MWQRLNLRHSSKITIARSEGDELKKKKQQKQLCSQITEIVLDTHPFLSFYANCPNTKTKFYPRQNKGARITFCSKSLSCTDDFLVETLGLYFQSKVGKELLP